MALISITIAGDTPTGISLTSVVRLDNSGELLSGPVAMTLTGGSWVYDFSEPAPGLSYRFSYVVTWADATTFPGEGAFSGTSFGPATRIDTTVVLTKAREITGNKASVAVGETMIPDAAILSLLDPIVRELSRAGGVDSNTTRETIFSAVQLQQDYLISSFVGAGVDSITEVYRSAAHVPDLLSDSDEVEPLYGLPMLRYGGNIQMGWQGDVMDVIVGTRRKQRNDRFKWEVVNKTDGAYLRLYPMPEYPEVVAVEYVLDGSTIDGLSEQYESVLVYAACAAILDAQINRIMSDRSITNTWGAAQGDRLKLLQAQRDRYESMYQAERDKLGV